MGWIGVAKKWRNPATQVAAAALFAGQIRARPVAAGREISWRRLSGGGAPPWLARVARWWPESALTA